MLLQVASPRDAPSALRPDQKQQSARQPAAPNKGSPKYHFMSDDEDEIAVLGD
jgi:hypothetical protein